LQVVLQLEQDAGGQRLVAGLERQAIVQVELAGAGLLVDFDHDRHLEYTGRRENGISAYLCLFVALNMVHGDAKFDAVIGDAGQ
jgi:hypothetical protein